MTKKKLSYGEYLKIDNLLKLQSLKSKDEEGDPVSDSVDIPVKIASLEEEIGSKEEVEGYRSPVDRC